MASSRVSPLRRPTQLPPTPHLKGPDDLKLPKYHVADPLLGSLSPESTLQALSSTNAVPNTEQAAHDILARSISQASSAERALGIRAAVVAQKLGQWYREVQSWKWPRRADTQLGKGFISPSDAEESIYCGSLPVAVVEEHEKRIEEIQDGMDSLDVEELKEHVLNAHIPGRSRPSSANSTMSIPPPLSYIQLSDFTAVITATILRALPYLSRLNGLLSTWNVRLLVLRQIPGLLQSLRFTRSELNSDLGMLKSMEPPTETDVLYSISNYHAKRVVLESMVVSAGRRIDYILDSLDGREDTLPESWIDDLEAIEADFATWVMEAEKRTVHNEWRRQAVRSSENDRRVPSRILPVQTELDTRDNPKAPLADTSNHLSAQPSSPKSPGLPNTPIKLEYEAVPELEPTPQPRPVPLQTGRTQFMETIVEEIGSPLERPLSRTAGDIANIPELETRITPEFSSVVSSDLAHLQETSRQRPDMQLDSVLETASPAILPQKTQPNAPKETEIIMNDPKVPVDVSHVEEPLRIPEFEDNSSADSSIKEPVTPPKENTSLPPTAMCAEQKCAEDSKPLTEFSGKSASLATEPVHAESTRQEDQLADILTDKSCTKRSEPLAQPDAKPVNPIIIEPVHVDSAERASEPTASHSDDGRLEELKPMIEPEEQTVPMVASETVRAESVPLDSHSVETRLEETKPQAQPYSQPVTMGLAKSIFAQEDPIQHENGPSEPKEFLEEPKLVNGPGSQLPSMPSTEGEVTEPLQRESESTDIRPDETVESLRPEIESVAKAPNLGVEFEHTVPVQQNAESLNQPSLEVTPLQRQQEEVAKPHLSPLFNALSESAHPLESHIILENDASISDGEQKLVEVVDLQPTPVGVDQMIPICDAAESATPKAHTIPSQRCGTPPNDSVAHLPNLFVPYDSSKTPTEQEEEHEQQDGRNTPKKPLDSPIKLSKTRPGRLDLDKHNSKPRARRGSNASNGSMSDYPSLASSPEMPEPRSSSTNGTPLLFETPPHFPTGYRPSDSVRQSNDHILREDRLAHLDAQKPSPRETLTHNRALSLPLQRFINERLELNYDSGSGTGSGPEEDPFNAGKSQHGKKTSAARRLKSKSATTTSGARRIDSQHLAPTREESSGVYSESSGEAQRKAQRQKNTQTLPQAEPLISATTGRLKKQLTTHPSLESIGPYKSKTGSAGLSKNAKLKTTSRPSSRLSSRPSSPNKQLIQAKDQMDVKINSILTSLPGSIHLVPADQDDDAVSVASSVPFRRERFRSHSPQGTPSRSFTPTPSLTLRPVGRRRHSHAPEEGSVKLYHLHRGGKSAPTKLFVRTVGENGERVMVRVGGGWADLAEYLREYAIHHGRRHVSETPRVEVEGLSARESPSYSPPGSRVPSGSGPARPRSVISNRPSSSLAVRKIRRSSNVSDMADLRSISAGDALNVSFSPKSSAFPGRRLSVSSNVSAGAMSSVSEFRHGSPGASQAMPLGLAGPKPRAKHATISPESEAWVEDVLGQTRRSSLRPVKTGQSPENEAEDITATPPMLPKSRSISDIGKAGSSKRVVLRGLR
ncbi:hypothetical protein BJX99DRAFT_18872 [Aspergillus californicus]